MPVRCILSSGSRGLIEICERVKRILYSYCQRRVDLASSEVCCVGSPRTRFLFFLYVTWVQPTVSSGSSRVAGGISLTALGGGASVPAGIELARLFSTACGVVSGMGVVPAAAGASCVCFVPRGFIGAFFEADFFFFALVGTISWVSPSMSLNMSKRFSLGILARRDLTACSTEKAVFGIVEGSPKHATAGHSIVGFFSVGVARLAGPVSIGAVSALLAIFVSMASG